ncbi:MAG: PDZ domain-containing protein [candidate division Zixibacteria bacterium]|nr:PDZ domain-containing protein [candidate division Zixibacteria bacterium]
MRNSTAVWTVRLVFGTATLLLAAYLCSVCFDDQRYKSSRFLVSAFVEIADSLYVVPEPEEMFAGAWLGMQSMLDPYTNFIPATYYQYVDEEGRGSFQGIGVEIAVRDGLVTVISPIAGSHAEEVGLRSGDQVISVDSIDVTDLPSDSVTSMIRGPAGTTVLMRIKRPGRRDPFEVRVERRHVDLNSVVYSGTIDSVGYIHLRRFSLTTPDEIISAIDKMSRDGISGLILDLRGNPGGFMSAAIYIAGLFLPEGKLILATKSRRGWENYSISTTDDGPLMNLPLVVLVNRGSASASEIVAGALQDYDRAVILGDTTFGKGLVQTNLMLDGGNALRVTTSKYYLPSGRLVQRFAEADWAKHMNISRSELNTAFRTEAGRDVYGGGGVAPDIGIAPDSMTVLATVLLYEGYFFRFAVDYRVQHAESVSVDIDDDVVDEFREYVYEQGFEFPNIIGEEISTLEDELAAITSPNLAGILKRMKRRAEEVEGIAWDVSKPYIRRNLRERFARVRGGTQEVYASSRMNNDRQIQAAIEILSDHDLYRSILEKQ